MSCDTAVVDFGGEPAGTARSFARAQDDSGSTGAIRSSHRSHFEVSVLSFFANSGLAFIAPAQPAS